MEKRNGGAEMKEKKQERRYFSREFKLRAVRMVDKRKPEEKLEDIAMGLGIHPNLLQKWRQKYSEFADKVFLNQDPLLQELERLRKDNANLQVERDILKKALTIFSQPAKP